MLALSIRQPFAELILRGVKTIEYRSRPTRLIGQRFWIYAAKNLYRNDSQPSRAQRDRTQSPISSDNLLPQTPPPWILEMAEALRLFGGDNFKTLPRGVIVGSAVIEKVVSCEIQVDGGERLKSKTGSTRTSGIAQTTTIHQWHLTDVKPLKVTLKPTRHPQPIWFRPFEV